MTNVYFKTWGIDMQLSEIIGHCKIASARVM